MYEGLRSHASSVYMFGVHFVGEDDDNGIPQTLYSCAAMEYTMGINAIPVMNVTLGRGEPLGGKRGTASEESWSLWYEVLKRTHEGYSLLPCSVYEVPVGGTDLTAIFHGYIVGSSLMDKASSGNSITAVRVQCLGIAALLMSSPLAAFRMTSGAVLAAVLTGYKELPSAQGLSGNALDPQSTLDLVTAEDIVPEYIDLLEGVDIVSRISNLANIIVELGDSGREDSSMPEPVDDKLHIKECLFCNYTLNMNFEQFNTEASYNVELCRGLLNGLEGSSLYDSIVTTVNNTEIMLNVLPHFYRGGSWSDFRMEIAPSLAWDTTDKIVIPESYVMGINSMNNALAHMNDPNVFVVSYGDSVGPVEITRSGGIPECVGVFARQAELMEYARLRFGMSSGAQKKDEALKLAATMGIEKEMYKVRCYSAPKWLDYAYLLKGRTLDSLETPEDEPPDDINAKGGTQQAEEDGLVHATQVADDIAKALFTYIYGRSDTALIELTPNLRFGLLSNIGCLENHIGKTVVVGVIQGTLRSVHYSYAAGEKATHTYSIELDRVRIYDPENEPEPIQCPLYTRLTEADKERRLKQSQYNYKKNREMLAALAEAET